MELFDNFFRLYTEKEKKIVIFTFFSGFSIFILNFIAFSGKEQFAILSAIINIIAVAVAFGALIRYQYKQYNTEKEIESNFSIFLTGISEGLKSNMTLPQAIKYSSKNNYGALNPYVSRIVSQISWGFSLEKVLMDFAEKLKNPLITRSVSTIIETYQSGGNIAASLSAVANSVTEIEKIKRERTSKISSQMLQGYIIYFIFLLVMIGIQNCLVPLLVSGGFNPVSSGNVPKAVPQDLSVMYSVRFKHLAIIQGFFSGIIIGKLATGSVSSGLKHSVVMVVIGYAALTISSSAL